MISLLKFLFPPLCQHCGEHSETKHFCESCWSLCAPPDPISRCRHCFEELDLLNPLCSHCQKEKKLSIPRAYVFDPESPQISVDEVETLASFAILQWIQLDWPTPDAIIPMPDSVFIASAFARMLNLPLIKALSFAYEYKEGRLEEDEHLLLFDVSNPIPHLQKAATALACSFPKRIYLLSLYPIC